MNPTSSLFLFLLLVKRRTCLCTSLLVPSFFAVSKTPSSPPAVPPRFSIPSLEFSAYTYIHVCWPPPCLQPPRRPQSHQQSLFVPQSPPWSSVHMLTYTSVGTLLFCSLQDALKSISSPSLFLNLFPGDCATSTTDLAPLLLCGSDAQIGQGSSSNGYSADRGEEAKVDSATMRQMQLLRVRMARHGRYTTGVSVCVCTCMCVCVSHFRFVCVCVWVYTCDLICELAHLQTPS